MQIEVPAKQAEAIKDALELRDRALIADVDRDPVTGGWTADFREAYYANLEALEAVRVQIKAQS